jgi:hypothetical protein
MYDLLVVSDLALRSASIVRPVLQVKAGITNELAADRRLQNVVAIICGVCGALFQ